MFCSLPAKKEIKLKRERERDRGKKEERSTFIEGEKRTKGEKVEKSGCVIVFYFMHPASKW